MEFPKTTPRDAWKNIVGLVLVIVFLTLIARYVDIAAIRARVEDAGPLAPILLVAAKASTIIIAPLGGTPLYPIAGAVFGFWYGSLLLVLGDALGGTVSFFLSRIFGRGLVERMVGNNNGLLAQALEVMGTPRGFLMARLGFLTFPEITCWGAGLTKLSFLPFFLIYTSVGVPVVFIGAGLGAIIADTGAAAVPLGMIGSTLLFAVTFSMFFNMMMKKKAEKERGGEEGSSRSNAH